MKALTVRQPHASLIAVGAKRYETRSWPAPKTLKPGDLLAIHAAACRVEAAVHRLPEAVRRTMAEALGMWTWESLWEDTTKGAILCICRFLKCWPTDGADLSAKECLFGDWRPGRFAWELEVAHKLHSPIPAKGQQGVWEWEPPEWLAAELAAGYVSGAIGERTVAK